jgi:hypothetical protein
MKVVSAGREGRLTGLVLRAARGLFLGYFALVMATGIVSIACYRLGQGRIALPPVFDLLVRLRRALCPDCSAAIRMGIRCRGIWMIVAERQSVLVLIVGLTGGRPGPRFGSRAARRR